MAPTAISLFSGLGGLDLGARIAGVEVLLATDIDPGALELLGEAQGTPTISSDIEDLLADGTILLDALGDGETTLLLGGPPCTPFSHAGFWLDSKRAGEDPSAALLDRFIDAVRLVRPQAFILENVPGLTFKNYRRFFDSFINRARRAGYSVTYAVLDASDFSVAQARKRLFVLGTRGQSPSFEGIWNGPCRSSSWALMGLPDELNPPEPDERPTGKHRTWLDAVPPGENYLCLTKRRGHPTGPFRYRSRYWSFLLKLHPDRPASTVPAQRVTYNGPFHWSGRHLRIRELARLQGFPDWQPLAGDLTVARRHVGNAVPPLLGAALIHRVLVTLGMAEPEGHPEALQVASSPVASFQDIAAKFPTPPETASPA